MPTYHIITIGCQMNQSDSERIAAHLEEHGFLYSAEPQSSGAVILVTCGVRQSAEDRIYGSLANLKRTNPGAKIVITGCLAERADVRKRLHKQAIDWLPIRELGGLASLLKNEKRPISAPKSDYFSIPPRYSSASSALVPIGNGCDNFCSYCVVPYARGREAYRPAEEIIREVRGLAKRNCPEIVLIAQNVNSYAPPGEECSFASLLKQVSSVAGKFWIRFATSHPKDMSDELIEMIASGEKLCKHIHLPIQSGDNRILEAMNRQYTVEHYKQLIHKIRLKIPDASVSTDAIVGFPGESKRQFLSTARLFKEAGFDQAYVSQYSPRPGTAAFRLKDNVGKQEKKRREALLTHILRKTALVNNAKYMDKSVAILAEGFDKRGRLFGRTSTNKKTTVLGKASRDDIGKFVNVRIREVRDFGLAGVREA